MAVYQRQVPRKGGGKAPAAFYITRNIFSYFRPLQKPLKTYLN